MSERERRIVSCINWNLKVLIFPQKVISSRFDDLFLVGDQDTTLSQKLTGVMQISTGNFTCFPFVPKMKYPPIVKAFVVTGEEQYLTGLPTPAELGFMTFIGDDGTYCTVNEHPDFYGVIKCVFLPDLRDIEGLIIDEDVEGYLFNVRGFPLSEQLEQEMNEAVICRNHALPIATIATLSIAMETACKIVLENEKISYFRNKDGLNDLLSNLVKNGLLSEKDRQACLSLKGLRNAVDHSHTGTVSHQNAELFYTTGKSLINTILQSAMHNRTTQN